MTPADAVDAAFAAQPREGFLPPEQRPHAALDRPLPIGWGQTNSQPTTVANMLRLLQVAPGMWVLDVGAGSGWTTALLAHLVGPEAVRNSQIVSGAMRRDQAALVFGLAAKMVQLSPVPMMLTSRSA